jgi:hypothetical protein
LYSPRACPCATGVDDDELELGGKRDAAVRERARVDEERVPIVAEARRHLIHHADARADEVRFRTLSRAREPDVVEVEGEGGPERAQHGNLECGARRQTGAGRDPALDQDVEAAESMSVGA